MIPVKNNILLYVPRAIADEDCDQHKAKKVNGLINLKGVTNLAFASNILSVLKKSQVSARDMHASIKFDLSCTV